MSVRPAFRRFAIVMFAILLPVVAHQLWDYLEIRRLVGEIEAIRAKGEPVTAIERHPLTEQRDAASYYLSGAMLALGTDPNRVATPIREWLAGAAPDRQAIPQLAKPLQQFVQDARDALTLADKAAALPFNGFPGGTEYSYQAASVADLSEVIAARTLGLSAANDGDAAIESILSSLQIRRAQRDGFLPSRAARRQVSDMLSLARPSPVALVRLQAALEAEDHPEQPLEAFLRERARYIDRLWRRYYGTEPSAPRRYTLPMRSVTESIARPWITHRIVATLQTWAELVLIERLPWPEKAKASADTLARDGYEEARRRRVSVGGFYDQNVALTMFAGLVDATPLVIDRSSRVAIAIERFRRDRNALPAALTDLVPQYLTSIPGDPYSGGPLVFRPLASAYTIYSVGPNQKDDGGDVLLDLPRTVKRGPDGQIIRVGDIGIRVLIVR